MMQNQKKKKRIAPILIVGAVMLIIAILIVVRMANKPSDPLVLKNDTASETSSPSSEPLPKGEVVSDSATTTEPSNTPSELDPAQIATVAIEPMSITVSYVKGVGGFDYEVMRSPSGTKYVQLSASRIAGSKCTNDVGQFASIIEKPTTDEKSTLAKSVTVNAVEYGLSLADASCTSNAELLKQYQTSFSDAFSLLK